MGKKSLSERTDLVKVHLDPNNDMTGRIFGEWKVLEYAGSRQGPWFKCKCSCGYIGIVRGIELRRGSMSCGHNGSTYKHGARRRVRGDRAAEYSLWIGMRDRCNNPNNESYQDYGSRGIKVCSRWDSFDAFYFDMGPRPYAEATIERVDNDKGYELSNCRWATRAEQRRNGRKVILHTCDGITMCLKDWCSKLGLKYMRILGRVRRGWLVGDALIGRRASKS